MMQWVRHLTNAERLWVFHTSWTRNRQPAKKGDKQKFAFPIASPKDIM